MRPNQKGPTLTPSDPPKDIYHQFLDKEVRRAWGQGGSLKEQAEIILDYDQAALQALGVHQPCNQCRGHINMGAIQQNAQNLLHQFKRYRQRLQDDKQPSPTREEWRTLLHACMNQLDELTRLCFSCKPLFQRTIIAQFHQVRKERRKGEVA